MMLEKEITDAIGQFSQKLGSSLKLKAIFFDMDGVLFDSMPNHAKAWSQTLKEKGLDLPEFEPYMNEGSTAFFTVRKMYKKYLDQEADDELCNEIKDRKHEIMGSMPKPDVMEFMPALLEDVRKQKVDRWVVTGSAQNILIDRLNSEYNGALQRDKMITAHDTKIGKPHPEPYLMAMEKSGYTTSNALVVENAPLGVESAKAAGLFTIGINTGPIKAEALKDAGADLVMSGSKELYELWPVLINLLR